LVFLFVVSTFGAELTFGELCKPLAAYMYEDMAAELPTLTIDSKPGTVKDARKSVLRIRDLLDICVFAYPDNEDDDQIADIRKLLDKGYERIGQFKDLEFVKHDDEEEEELLLECLDWVRKWDIENASHNNIAYMLNPSATHIYSDRKYTELSGFFWKIAEAKPASKYTGIFNFARLANKMVDFIRDALDKVVKVEDVTDLDGHDEFHDFRKTLRSVDYVSTVFERAAMPEVTIFKPDFKPQPVLDLIDDIYMEFGDLNSDIVSYLHDVEKGEDKDKLKKKKEKLMEDWEDLKKLIKKIEFDKVLKEYQEGLVAYLGSCRCECD